MRKLKLAGLMMLLSLITNLALAQKMINDQSYEDESFLKFKVKLMQAILDRDTAQLFALVDENVKIGMDELPSKKQFREIFRDDFYTHGVEYDLWKEMLEVISFGFRRKVMDDNVNFYHAQKGEVIYQAPSYQVFLEGEYSSHLFVLADNVNIREKPTIYSKSLGRVTQQRLTYRYPDHGVSAIFNDGYNWVEVDLKNGKTGYVADVFTSLKMSHEISIKKVNGEWKIVSFFSPPGC